MRVSTPGSPHTPLRGLGWGPPRCLLSSLAELSSHRCQDPSQGEQAGPWVPPGHPTHENISHPFAPACLSPWHLADGWHLPHRGWEAGEDGTSTKTAGVSLELTPVP